MKIVFRALLILTFLLSLFNALYNENKVITQIVPREVIKIEVRKEVRYTYVYYVRNNIIDTIAVFDRALTLKEIEDFNKICGE
jgi:hypothetical protein